jgi:hypothetical protein
MSVNFNRAALKKVVTRREYKIVLVEFDFPPYWDEGMMFYPQFKRGFSNTNKTIRSFQMRRYQTWKHNRKTQWK